MTDETVSVVPDAMWQQSSGRGPSPTASSPPWAATRSRCGLSDCLRLAASVKRSDPSASRLLRRPTVGVMVELLNADMRLMAHLTIRIESTGRLARDAQHPIPPTTTATSAGSSVTSTGSPRCAAAPDALEASISSSATGRGRRARTHD
jgi:hypothetical protein